MKTISLLLLLLIGAAANAQMYHRTKRNLGLYFGGAYGTGKEDAETTRYSFTSGLTHMISPGIYPKIGWTYNTYTSLNPRANQLNKICQQTIDASLLFDKRILKLVDGKRINYSCHYLSIGLIGAPEFHYLIKNASQGSSFSYGFMFGFSFTQICTNRGKASFTKTKQLDIFTRREFAPKSNQFSWKTTTNTTEFGIQMRFLRHQVKSSVHS